MGYHYPSLRLFCYAVLINGGTTQFLDSPEPSSLIIPLITPSFQYISALTFLVRGQGAGLAGAAAHQHEHIHPFAALGAFDLRKSGGVLSFVASIQKHIRTSCYLSLAFRTPWVAATKSVTVFSRHSVSVG